MSERYTCSKHSMTDVSVSAAPLPVSSIVLVKRDVNFFYVKKRSWKNKHHFLLGSFKEIIIDHRRVAKEISMYSFVCIIIF